MSTSSNILARGVRIPRSSLDTFLKRHNLRPSNPKRLHQHDAAAFDDLLARLGVKGEVRLFEPYLQSFKAPDHVFLCYDWVYVLAEKEVESSLKEEEPPMGFLNVIHQIQEDGLKVGTWVICFEEEWALFEEKFADTVVLICRICSLPLVWRLTWSF